MPNVNKVILIGNLTRDPEMRYLQSGTALCDFGLAVNRSFKRGDGQKGEEVLFVDVTAWGKQAELIAEYVKKGQPLYVEGRLKLDQWQTDDGHKRSKLGVTCEQFQFLEGRGGGGSSDGDAPAPAAKPTQKSIPF